MTTYTIRRSQLISNHAERSFSLLHDGERIRESELDFHAEADDYFVTLATIVNLLRQQLLTTTEKQNRIFEQTIKDLIYLQKHYRLTKKKSNR